MTTGLFVELVTPSSRLRSYTNGVTNPNWNFSRPVSGSSCSGSSLTDGSRGTTEVKQPSSGTVDVPGPGTGPTTHKRRRGGRPLRPRTVQVPQNGRQ